MWVVGCQSNPYVQAQVIHEGSLRFHCHPQTGPLQIPPTAPHLLTLFLLHRPQRLHTFCMRLELTANH